MVKPMYHYSLLGTLYTSHAITDESLAASVKDAVATAIEKVRYNPSHT
jgi:competence protein ComFB